MALSIKNREVEELARELARITKKPITEVVRDSLKREIERAKVVALVALTPSRVSRALEIAKRSAARPILDSRTPDEIIGYNERGTFG